MSHQLATMLSSGYQIGVAADGGLVTFGKPNKNGEQKVGSFARAMAFATKAERLDAGQMLYAKWLGTGNYRPIVSDVLGVKLLSKDACDVIAFTMLPHDGKQVSKDNFVAICKYIADVVRNKIAADPNKAPKGEKAFVYEVVRRVAEESDDAGLVIEQQ